MIKPRDRSGSAYCMDCRVRAVHERGPGTPLVIRHKPNCPNGEAVNEEVVGRGIPTPEPKHVGFTGTSIGATAKQLGWLWDQLLMLQGAGFGVFHHGDCIGADKSAHLIAHELGYVIVVHPPTNGKARAWCVGDMTREPKPYLLRNHDIVDESEFLLALPKGPEQLRSGTWATIRYANGQNKPVSSLLPEQA